MSRPVLGVVVWLLLGTPGYAQTLGTITGEVKDQSGSSIPGATVTAQNVATNAVRTQQSNEAGVYTFPAMPPGNYQVKAELQGFKTLQNAVELHVEETLRVDFQLEVGTLTELTEVSAATTLIATSNATVGTVIGNRLIVELPLNGRNYLSLISASPNVSAGFAGPGQAGDRQGGSRANQQISISGQRREFNYYTLDGVDNTDVNFNTYIFSPSIDALEEFKVQTGIYSAEFGRAAGQVNVVTKSGSNAFHGTVFEFHRNDKFDARPYAFTDAQAAAPKAPFNWHQFGYTAGGPVMRNRLFFMSNYEGYIDRKTNLNNFNLPTAGDAKRRFLSGRYATHRSGDVHGHRQHPELPDLPGQHDSDQSHSPDLAAAARVLSRAEPRRAAEASITSPSRIARSTGSSSRSAWTSCRTRRRRGWAGIATATTMR